MRSVAQETIPAGESSVGIIAKALFDIEAEDRRSDTLYTLSFSDAF